MEKHVFESGVAVVEVTPEKVVIKHKRGTYHGGKTKEIRIKSITGIEMKEPGMIMAGYIQFIFSGGKEADGWSRIDAAKNENTVMFRKKELPQFLECKALVERYIEQAQKSSSAKLLSDADELAKWLALKDAGAITEEEFHAKKRQILGL
jgi:Short C-terminal domain